MARSPFQGTWQPNLRPTVVHSPDALVYINGETDILGCSSCRRRFDFNRYITSIQVDLSIDSSPGSASVSLSIPRHSVDDFYFDGNPLLSPMMEIEIFCKGYYLLEGVPQYYPIFWGMITEVSDSYSNGEHTVSINCSDILKWWELCKMNINAAFTQPTGQQGRSIFGNVFYGSNPYDVIWTLAQQSFGDVVIGSGSLTSLYKEQSQRDTFNRALGDIMQYWNERFTRIRSNLLLYGTQGVAVRGTDLWDRYQRNPNSVATGRDSRSGSHFASTAVRQANGGTAGTQLVFDPTDSNVVAFRTQFMEAGQVNFWQSEFQTKLELANAAKEAIGFEFYMDVTGDIVFKPPFYNVDILGNKPVSWIQDIDIIDWDFSESEAEVVTQLQIQGSFKGPIDYGMGEEVTPFTSVTDYHLLRKYGWRSQTFNSEFMGSTHLMFYMGMDLLDQYNAKRWRGTVNIPIRPELRLGFPVYIAPKDQIWYIRGISHNIQMGGRAQTTLTLSAKRQKFVAPRGIGTIRKTSSISSPSAASPSAPLQGVVSEPTIQQLQTATFELNVGDAAQLPPDENTGSLDDPYAPLIVRHPKTGRLLGYPSVVMAYTRPFANISENRLARNSGRKPKAGERQQKIAKVNEAAQEELIATAKYLREATVEDLERETHITNRYSYGLNSAGVYTYAQDTDDLIKEILLLPRQNITLVTDDEGASTELVKRLKTAGTGLIRPISDSRGFEVIGHFKYGRGVALRDGSLVLSGPENNLPGGQANTRANVDLQVALSGDILDVLTAQSQGLTSFTSAYSNPVDAITTLSPDDLQSAASIEPSTGEVKMEPVAKNFIDSAPLGSAQDNIMSVSVEAGQLSRALTLTEMTLLEEDTAPNQQCHCLTGRSDLTFMNIGFQVNPINPAETDSSGIASDGTSVVSSSEFLSGDSADRMQSAREQISSDLAALRDEKWAEFQEALSADEAAAKVGGSTQYGDIWKSPVEEQNRFFESFYTATAEAARPAIVDSAVQSNFEADMQADALTVLNRETNATLTSDSNLLNPFISSNNPQQAIHQVESYLTNLYSILDESHQEYEKVIRGQYLDRPSVNAQDVRFGTTEDSSGWAPPFSTIGRAQGGDPEALARTISTSADNVGEAWSELGSKLKSDSERGRLEANLQVNIANLNNLRKERERLESARGNAILIPEDVDARLKQLNSSISETERQIERDRLKLATGV